MVLEVQVMPSSDVADVVPVLQNAAKLAPAHKTQFQVPVAGNVLAVQDNPSLEYAAFVPDVTDTATKIPFPAITSYQFEEDGIVPVVQVVKFVVAVLDVPLGIPTIRDDEPANFWTMVLVVLAVQVLPLLTDDAALVLPFSLATKADNP